MNEELDARRILDRGAIVTEREWARWIAANRVVPILMLVMIDVTSITDLPLWWLTPLVVLVPLTLFRPRSTPLAPPRGSLRAALTAGLPIGFGLFSAHYLTSGGVVPLVLGCLAQAAAYAILTHELVRAVARFRALSSPATATGMQPTDPREMQRLAIDIAERRSGSGGVLRALLPVNLMFNIDFWHWIGAPWWWLAVIFALAAAAGLLFERRRWPFSREREVLHAALFAAGALLVAAGVSGGLSKPSGLAMHIVGYALAAGLLARELRRPPAGRTAR